MNKYKVNTKVKKKAQRTPLLAQTGLDEHNLNFSGTLS